MSHNDDNDGREAVSRTEGEACDSVTVMEKT